MRASLLPYCQLPTTLIVSINYQFCEIYLLIYTLHLHCNFHIELYTYHFTHCTLHIALYTLYFTHCTLPIAFYTLHFTHCNLYIALYKLHFTHHTLPTTFYILHFTLGCPKKYIFPQINNIICMGLCLYLKSYQKNFGDF